MGDIGGLLVGVAALGTLGLAAYNARSNRRHGKVLAGIDAAVNNVEPGTPPLWKRIDLQTEHLGGLAEQLSAHSKQDAANFAAIATALAELRATQVIDHDLDAIIAAGKA